MGEEGFEPTRPLRFLIYSQVQTSNSTAPP